MGQTKLTAISAFGARPLRGTKGVVVRELDGLGIATILARKGCAPALATRVRERFGIALVAGPRLATAGDLSFIGIAPGTWLAIQRGGGNGLAVSLRDALGDLASIVDQSDGLAVVHVSGARVREALCKLFAIDLDARAFKPGDAAVSPAADIGATLWRVDDAQEVAAFEIATHRSFAESFRDHLLEAVAEFD